MNPNPHINRNICALTYNSKYRVTLFKFIIFDYIFTYVFSMKANEKTNYY